MWAFRFFLITINLIYDFYKILKGKNIKWNKAFYDNKVYGYSDFILKDLPNLNVRSIILFIFMLNINTLIFKIQIFFFIYFLVLFGFKLMFNLEIKIEISQKIIKRILIEYPKMLSIMFLHRIRSKKLPNKEEIEKMIINYNHIIIWGNIRIITNNCVLSTKIIINLLKDPNIKYNYSYFRKSSAYIYINFFDTNLKKFENTLLNRKDIF
jgi:hypothetical protein